MTILPESTQIWQLAPYNNHYLHFFDEATTVPLNGSPTNDGWVSLYGELNGGVMFDTNLFSLTPTPVASLHWDFGITGYNLSYIVVNDSLDDCKIYSLGSSTTGNLDLTPFDTASIQTINLFGHIPGQPASEGGLTLTLLVIALILLLPFYDKKTTR